MREDKDIALDAGWALEELLGRASRIKQLEAALAPFAAAIAFTTSTMADDRPVGISYTVRTDVLETGDTLPNVFTVGDVRRAASALGKI